ncbi:DUF4126 domain-containing protein [Sphingomonas sp.]|uniref:DUF4126 domain-containing protein n=1 Tax=Sphingomonas sp. TaxID=28214 RepID=UPI00286A7B22|nr:DUF4126 domain-containing protein [Sphingomonas sp.]
MNPTELIALAASTSLLAGWRLYLVTFVTGLAMHFGWIALPANLHQLDILANWWVIGAAGIGTLAEFFADKVQFVDSAWDAVHAFIRPLGGALLALAIVDSGNPTWQALSFLLGGGAALVAHTGKAGARALVNASPEPYSNIVVSAGEDVVATGLMAMAIANPVLAAIVAGVVVLGSGWLFYKARRFLKGLFNAVPRKRPMKNITPS